jgi:hypothetical protein
VSPRIRHLLGRFARCRSFESRFSIFREFFLALEGPERWYFQYVAFHSLPEAAARRAFQMGAFMAHPTPARQKKGEASTDGRPPEENGRAS